jgi:hypothetical protein
MWTIACQAPHAIGIKNILLSSNCKTRKPAIACRLVLKIGIVYGLLASPHPVCTIGSGIEPTIIVGSLFLIVVNVSH